MLIARKQLGKRIKLRRVALDMKQSELSQRSGVSQSTVSDVERGARTLSVEHLAALAQALDCSVCALLEHEGETLELGV